MTFKGRTAAHQIIVPVYCFFFALWLCIGPHIGQIFKYCCITVSVTLPKNSLSLPLCVCVCVCVCVCERERERGRERERERESKRERERERERERPIRGEGLKESGTCEAVLTPNQNMNLKIIIVSSLMSWNKLIYFFSECRSCVCLFTLGEYFI